MVVAFIFSGGGTTEADRAEVLTRQLSVPVKPQQVSLVLCGCDSLNVLRSIFVRWII